MRDSEFAFMWASGRISVSTGGLKHSHPPMVGELTADSQLWLQADSPDHRLEDYTAADQKSAGLPGRS